MFTQPTLPLHNRVEFSSVINTCKMNIRFITFPIAGFSQLELQATKTNRAAVYAHVCLDSYNIWSEDFDVS